MEPLAHVPRAWREGGWCWCPIKSDVTFLYNENGLPVLKNNVSGLGVEELSGLALCS